MTGAGRPIGAQTILPAEREPFSALTADAVRLVGELALPPGGRAAQGALILLHPLPTAGGSMDSHLFRKAAWRLPALADLAVVRFNTRGTGSRLGRSEGEFDGGAAEARDVAAVVAHTLGLDLPTPWLVGWSFGSELALMHAAHLPVAGVIAVSPPLKQTRSDHLIQWAAARKPVTALVPEHDEFLKPAQARARLALIPGAKVVEGRGASHLWIGEKAVRQALDAIVAVVRPGFGPLPRTWDGPSQTFNHEHERLASS
ncbi:MAG: alpha/beta fold hydrolase [Bifidobacteriaceae bacterium]|jgi:alpha/beta superfamily hydrolase|nr:alpha/beta fold hydrolase [Bifidobacteriaceae bacterium]